jgi:hypothetical protein
VAHQPKISDKEAWKQIANSVLFFAGWITTLVCIGNQHISTWVLFAGLVGVGISTQNYMFWKNDYVPWRDDPDPEPDPESKRKPFQYGPRDTGPANPPPWPKIVMALMGFGLFIAGIIVGGMGPEYVHGLYVRGPAAFACITGLMFAMAFVGEGFDKAREETNRRDGGDDEL